MNCRGMISLVGDGGGDIVAEWWWLDVVEAGIEYGVDTTFMMSSIQYLVTQQYSVRFVRTAHILRVR